MWRSVTIGSTGADRYHGTLEHLASWGIVAAAPDTETGLAPSVLNLAFDLGTTLDIIAGVRLGPGKISVHPDKLGVAGHGFGRVGGGVRRGRDAGQAEGRRSRRSPTITKPPAEEPAATLKVPGLILADPGDPMSLRSNAVRAGPGLEGRRAAHTRQGRSRGLVEGRATGSGRRTARCGPRHPESGAGADDGLSAATR